MELTPEELEQLRVEILQAEFLIAQVEKEIREECESGDSY